MRTLTIFIIITFFSLSSCITTVSLITKKPQKYNGKRVVVLGKVINSLDLKDIQVFAIKSGKKHIEVVTPNYLPWVGEWVLVKGKVIINYKYRRSKFLVIKEEKKRSKKIKIKKNKEKKLN